jgi:hypothetical protein
LGRTVLIDAASADETTGRVPCEVGQRQLRFDITGSGTISGGAIILECAPTLGYTGTWSALYTPIDATNVTGGATQAVFIQGCFDAVGARISTAIAGGGTVTVSVTGN